MVSRDLFVCVCVFVYVAVACGYVWWGGMCGGVGCMVGWGLCGGGEGI